MQRNKTEEKKMRAENEQHAKEIIEKMSQMEERKRIEMETER